MDFYRKSVCSCWRNTRRIAIVLFVCLVLPAIAMAQSPRHSFTVDDAAAVRGAEAIAVSPDGKTILYKVTHGGTNGADQTEWKLIAVSGGSGQNLNVPEKFEPAGFTPDGKAIYGKYEVDGKAQLATFPLANPGTPAAVAATPTAWTALPRGIRSASISPDGRRYAILADPRLPDPLATVHTVVEAEPASIYVINADGTGGTWWCPTLQSVGGIAWSADGSSLAVASQTPKIGFHDVRSMLDTCSPAGPHHVVTIDNVTSGVGWINGAKDLVFLSTTSPVLTADHVWTVSAGGGSPQDRTPNLQGSAVDLVVDAKGNAWVAVVHGVQTEVDAFRDNALVPAYKWPEGTIEGTVVVPQIASAPALYAFTVGDPQHAQNVAVAQSDKMLKRITNEGDDQLAKVALGESRIVRWKSPEGVALEGIVTFPADYARGKRYPFMVLPHGGPEGNDNLDLSSRPRIIAGMGYIVLQPQYRGSTGYGTEFMSAIYQHFGDRAYRDVDSATDYAVAQGWADPNRLTIFGWSAGGFMTAWTVTQTHRYKAAIEGAGITDWLSFIWTSDVQQTDYDARWTDKDPNAFLDFSAVMHSENVSTPLLILHGASDERVPTYQGRELFEILAARGKTTRMVTYPGSPHSPRLWEQRQDVYREIAAWLAKYNP